MRRRPQSTKLILPVTCMVIAGMLARIALTNMEAAYSVPLMIVAAVAFLVGTVLFASKLRE